MGGARTGSCVRMQQGRAGSVCSSSSSRTSGVYGGSTADAGLAARQAGWVGGDRSGARHHAWVLRLVHLAWVLRLVHHAWVLIMYGC